MRLQVNTEKQIGGVGLGLGGEVCGWVDGKLVVQMVAPPSGAPGPGSILGFFSVRWRQEKVWGGEVEKRFCSTPRPPTQSYSRSGKYEKWVPYRSDITSLQSAFSSTRTQSPSISESFQTAILSLRILCFSQLIPAVNPIGLQAGTHVPFLPWGLTLGTHAEK